MCMCVGRGDGREGCKKRFLYEKYTSNVNSVIIFEVFSHHLRSALVEVGINYP